MSIRISGGDFLGRVIDVPPKIRPTQTRVRQTVFDVLQKSCVDSSVLDLFAGSGAYGIEAISRGAKSACFVEAEKKNVDIINKNLISLQIQNQCRVVNQKIHKKMPHFFDHQQKFDLVFIDPPYHQGLANDLLMNWDWTKILNPNALMTVETEFNKNDDFPSFEIENLQLIRKKKYGDTLFCLFRFLDLNLSKSIS